MEISVSLPLDAGGFLRRQCASCGREFKWHHGPTEGRPADFVDPPVYFCPYCSKAAPSNEWLTAAQREHLLAAAARPARQLLTDALEEMARNVSRGPLKMSVDPGEEPAGPEPLHEPSDMTAVASPCHPWEPIKVASDWASPIHCLVCGRVFAT